MISMAVIAMVGFQANAFKTTVIIDDPKHAAVCERTEGDEGYIYTPLTYPETGYVVETEDPQAYFVTVFLKVEEGSYMNYKMYKAEQEEPEEFSRVGKTGVQTLSVFTTQYADMIIKVYVKENKDDASIKLNIKGDLSKIQAVAFPDGRMITELAEGEQTITFNTDMNTSAYIMLPAGVTSLYKVTHNGKELDPYTLMGDTYQYNLRDINKSLEHTVVVETDFPDIDFNLSINVTEGCEDFITSVTADGEPLADPTKVHAGKRLMIQGNCDDYIVEDVKLNGEYIQFYSAWSGIVKGDMAFEFNVAKLANFNVKVTVDNAAALRCEYRNKEIALVDGENTVVLKEDVTYIQFFANPDFKILSMTVDGDEVDGTWGWYAEDLEEGSEIVITTSEKPKIDVVLYCNEEASQLQPYWDYSFFNLPASMDISLLDDYQLLTLDEDDAIYNFCLFEHNGSVYVNNDKLAPIEEYEDEIDWEINFSDGDVVKIFVGEEPQMYSVSYELVGISEINVTRDYITELEDAAAGHEELPGTVVGIAANERITSVEVDEHPVEVGPDNKYEFVVNGDTKVVVTGTSGVEAINAESASKVVYNMQGMKVSEDGIKSLPAGLYICNGAKVSVK